MAGDLTKFHERKSTTKPPAASKKQIIAVAVFAVAVVSGASLYNSRAQDAEDQQNLTKQRAAAGIRSPQDMRQTMLDAQARELGLNEDQKKAFGEKQQKLFSGFGPIFQDSSLSQEQKRQKAAEIWAKGQAELRNGLTPDQQVKYDAMNARMAQQFGGRRGNAGRFGPTRR